MAGLDSARKNPAPSKFAFLKEALTIEPSPSSDPLDSIDETITLADLTSRDTPLPALMKFSDILDRQVDTRPLDPHHVDQLAESIAVLGLLEPLVVDLNGILLAGGHRKAAIAQVQAQNPTAYTFQFPNQMTPVRVMPFDSKSDPDLALQIEVSENEKRRDYTPAEIRLLAERLKESGYTDAPGRPAKGEKRLRPAIEVIVGKSLRQVRRILNEETKTRTHVRVSQKRLILGQLASAAERWLELSDEEKADKKDQALSKHAAQVLKAVQDILKTEA
jgi:ParB family transcriptional regulator, chromosome partitioning protein